VQGLCTGGEYNGAAIFALEHFGKNHPGFIGGLITSSCVIGFLAANGLATLTTTEGAPDWFWRVPFLLGTSISITGYFLRKKLVESPDFNRHKRQQGSSDPKLSRSPIAILFADHNRQLAMGAIIGGINGVLSYTLYTYLSTHLDLVAGIGSKDAMAYMLYGLFTFMIAAPVMGLLFEKFKRPLNYFKLMTLLIAGLCFVEYQLIILGQSWSIVLAEVMAGLFAASIAGPVHAYLQNIFPVSDRYTGVSFSYSLGMSLMGGTTPLIMTIILNKTAHPLAPAFYTAGCAILAFILISCIRLPELTSDTYASEVDSEAEPEPSMMVFQNSFPPSQ
jgi:MHS family proline/betaine transporter-like MFS transporter